ncbi:superoxide dismutase [Ni] [uncultured Ilyobacter sp.]|uniref:superoxide dismutase [Ni] n=1 Tax=uncultured Ilyobacter sp. TaxID=544433 RepID=UPI002AA7DB2F|nr:superoxide dismutase [Ni] [uncultured Ilyobacter sp.]
MNKLVLIFSLLILIPNYLFAHCEVPCGIYDDELRFKELYENTATIEKSTKIIIEISKEKSPDYNQLVRWINTKEIHAEKNQYIVSQYFLHQRIKPASSNSPEYKDYIRALELLHHISVYSMKTKQSTDLKNIELLKDAIHDFQHHYLKEDK